MKGFLVNNAHLSKAIDIPNNYVRIKVAIAFLYTLMKLICKYNFLFFVLYLSRQDMYYQKKFESWR